jgi:hypothetical protein
MLSAVSWMQSHVELRLGGVRRQFALKDYRLEVANAAKANRNASCLAIYFCDRL